MSVFGVFLVCIFPHSGKYGPEKLRIRTLFYAVTLLFIFLGRAVVTENKAAIWVDGRYHDQVYLEVDCNWTPMLSGIFSIITYLGHYIPLDTIPLFGPLHNVLCASCILGDTCLIINIILVLALKK